MNPLVTSDIAPSDTVPQDLSILNQTQMDANKQAA